MALARPVSLYEQFVNTLLTVLYVLHVHVIVRQMFDCERQSGACFSIRLHTEKAITTSVGLL